MALGASVFGLHFCSKIIFVFGDLQYVFKEIVVLAMRSPPWWHLYPWWPFVAFCGLL